MPVNKATVTAAPKILRLTEPVVKWFQALSSAATPHLLCMVLGNYQHKDYS
ncbi:hypothetical protein [Allocoleopsis franciscana]|uniref:hypothetical protein n=1 Tax=Allocoleopsis franciscana TaxID=2886352 RepID=UPI00031885B4|nr:hypothetical protein [Allocoleopsis franciscana]